MGGIDLIQDLGLVMLVAAAAASLCQRIGLPVVIGYLGAGVLISPHTHSFGLISDTDRIQAIAQVGLVFLIFSIGQGLNLQRLKRVGLPLVAGTLMTAVLVLLGCRWIGTLLGWSGEQSLVLGAILMVSSTAVLGKCLRDARQLNTTFGQTALTVTALDDLVAVVMLTVLASLSESGGTDAGAVMGTIFRLKAVIVTMAIAALILIPRLLKRVTGTNSEVGALIIAGVLLSMALVSAMAGFSAALGAFLLGTVVSTTGKSEQVGRVLGTLGDVFGPVFFVAMGMLLDLGILGKAWPLVIGVVLLVFVLRILAASTALILVGHSVRDASRAAICLTPIGEFSLILALTGVQGGLVPETFYAAAVGVCLFTTVTTPLLIRHSQGISSWIERRQPGWFAEMVAFYHEWVERLKQKQHASILWRLTAPRVVQVVVLVFFVSGLLCFATPLISWAEKWIGTEVQASSSFALLFWGVFFGMIAAPLVAIWRQVEALAMICAEAATQVRSRKAALRPLFEKLLRTAMLFSIGAWFATLFPYDIVPKVTLLLFGAVAVVLLCVFSRRLARMHSRFEIELRDQISNSSNTGEASQTLKGLDLNRDEEMQLAEVTLRADTRGVGGKIADLPLRSGYACTVVRIERHGVIVANPTADTVLFPQDKLLLLGKPENLQKAEEWLAKAKESNDGEETPLEELSLGNLKVPSDFPHEGKSLGDLAIGSRFGIQIIRINRGRRSIVSPGPAENIVAGDHLLVLGTSEQVSHLAVWLSN